MTNKLSSSLRIGVDMGGTNTDAVVVDVAPGAETVILAATKTPTTADVTQGVQKAIEIVLEKVPHVSRSCIQAVNVGTTHFVNALIQRSERHLERVAVIRLAGPYTRSTPPFAGFPYELRELIGGPHFFVNGGLQIDSSEISQVDPEEIMKICEVINNEGIRCVAISSVYAPIDFTIKQEEAVEAIIKRLVPGVYTSVSKKVANYGLLERENATILNSALLPFAHSTVQGFARAAEMLELSCPFFVTSNDGTLLTLAGAAELPIRTFSSGPTNSMRGASFLAQLADPDARRETALVVDIGGTTTEVGVLLPSGFPRQAANHHELCGVRLNFAMPHVTSLGLGGGSLVRYDDHSGKILVGPTSVGYRITQESLVFGGQTLTATDVAVAAGDAMGVGEPSAVQHLDQKVVVDAKARIKTMLELALDSMKTSPNEIPVYLVGGGAPLAPERLRGISKVHRFPHYQCANAVGAAIAQVAGTIDAVENIENTSVKAVRQSVEARAIARAIAAGASPDTVKVVESEALPVAYTTGKCRFFVKAAGDWSGKLDPKDADRNRFSASTPAPRRPLREKKGFGETDTVWNPSDIVGYRPNIRDGAWYLSELDLDFICIGTFILGCGGGGDPHQSFLAARELLRAGASIKVVDLKALPASSLVGWGGAFGSPEVISERLIGPEYNEALTKLWHFMKIEGRVSALAGVEIGGSNGMINLLSGASSALDLPVIDGDFMGRAYPTSWQTTPNVYDESGKGANSLPLVICSGDGSVMFVTETHEDRLLDAIPRAACVEMGTLVGQAYRPLSVDFCRKGLIKNTISLSWRLGKAVTIACKQHNIGNIGEVLVDALGGPSTARVLFAGKIVDLTRRVFKGHTVGEVVIESLAQDEVEESQSQEMFEGRLTIPFKNENLYCEHELNGQKKIIATVPDLICVLDAQNGQALGTPDYKYGRRVLVLGITAAPQWTDTDRGLELGDLRAFGYDDIPYEPLGVYIAPRSVIEEFAVAQ